MNYEIMNHDKSQNLQKSEIHHRCQIVAIVFRHSLSNESIQY